MITTFLLKCVLFSGFIVNAPLLIPLLIVPLLGIGTGLSLSDHVAATIKECLESNGAGSLS